MALGGSAARRYAEALIDLASGPDEVAALSSALVRLRDALGEGGIRSLGDPSIPLARRSELVTRVTADQPRAVGSLLQLLVRRRRISLLPAITGAFGDIVDRRAGIATARITTPVALDEAAQKALVDRLERASGKKLRASFVVDPTLIGGAKVQVGDHLVDASIRARLEALRVQLAAQ